jgi:hypothetical protein
MQATPKGYQAVVTKHPVQRGGDQAVNDNAHCAAPSGGLQRRPEGAVPPRLTAGRVHAESRYGIVELPNFSTGPDDFKTTASSPRPPGKQDLTIRPPRAP